MIDRRKLPKVLLMLAAFVFFSANTIHFVEDTSGALYASVDKTYNFDMGKDAHRRGPYLNLKAAVLINYSNGEILYSRGADQPRSIASLSKLVAAMVLLDMEIDFNDTITITREDSRRSAKSRLRTGYQLTVGDLMHSALMASDNRATRALARSAAGSIDAFVAAMNRKARSIGLSKTIFFDPTGLDKRNKSTALEVAKMLHYAYDYPTIARLTSKKKHRLQILNRKNRYYNIINTNRFTLSPYKVLAGKTGYIQASDYCLATLVSNSKGERVTAVILGAPKKGLRYREARRLVDWGFRQI